MTRARELANFADDTAGLETLTVSDVTDLSVSASNINSATNQITDSSTDLNVDSNTLVVDKSTNRVGITNASPGEALHIKTTADADYGIKVENDDTQAFCKVQSSGNALYGGNAGVNIISGSSFATAMHINSSGNIGINTSSFTGTDTGRKVLEINGDSGAGALLNLSVGGTRQAYLYHDTSTMYLVNTVNTDLLIGTNNTTRLTIKADGKVGIGTTSPDSLTHLSTSTGSGSSNGPTLLLESFRTGMMPANARVGRVAFKQGWTVGAYDIDRAYIDAVVDVDAVWVPGVALEFSTGKYTEAPTARMRIDSNGQIKAQSRFRIFSGETSISANVWKDLVRLGHTFAGTIYVMWTGNSLEHSLVAHVSASYYRYEIATTGADGDAYLSPELQFVTHSGSEKKLQFRTTGASSIQYTFVGLCFADPIDMT